MAEYDWTPPLPTNLRKRGVLSGAVDQTGSRPSSPAVGQAAQRQSTTMQWFDANTTREPSTYLFEMITFLTAYVDSVLIMLNETIKTRTYRMALEHINQGLLVSRTVNLMSPIANICLQGYLVGADVPRLNEQALKNLADDVTFIEKEVKRLEKPGLDNVFDEIKSVGCKVLFREPFLMSVVLDDQPHPLGSDPSVYGAIHPSRILHQCETKEPQDCVGKVGPLRGGSGQVYDRRCDADE